LTILLLTYWVSKLSVGFRYLWRRRHIFVYYRKFDFSKECITHYVLYWGWCAYSLSLCLVLYFLAKSQYRFTSYLFSVGVFFVSFSFMIFSLRRIYKEYEGKLDVMYYEGVAELDPKYRNVSKFRKICVATAIITEACFWLVAFLVELSMACMLLFFLLEYSSRTNITYDKGMLNAIANGFLYGSF